MKIKQMETVAVDLKSAKSREEHTFQMGSVSKLVTAWAILLLQKMGKLNIDEPINNYLKNWKIESKHGYADSITIKMVLSHFAGLSRKSFLGVSNINKLEDTLHYLKRKKVKSIYKPDLRPIYSGGGYMVLQLLIEEISNMNFSDFTEKFIFQPLGMNNTTFDYKKVDKDKLLDCYGFLGQKTSCRFYSQKAAAGLYSTIEDISIFAIENMNYDNPVIGNMLNIIQRRYNRVFPNCLGCYAFNASQKKLIASKGINLGWFACFLLLPDEGNGFVYLSNSNRGKNLFSIIGKEWMENNKIFIVGEQKKFFYL